MVAILDYYDPSRAKNSIYSRNTHKFLDQRASSMT